MSVLCYMSLSFGRGRVCSCERAGCVLRTLYLYVVMFWFLCSQVVLAGGKYIYIYIYIYIVYNKRKFSFIFSIFCVENVNL